MPCGFCKKIEKGASEDYEYLCSRCIAMFINRTVLEVRKVTTKLRENDHEEQANFLEEFLFHTNFSIPKLIVRLGIEKEMVQKAKSKPEVEYMTLVTRVR